jgi:peptidoglycan/LPS O-acetylase OafA/YrhL
LSALPGIAAGLFILCALLRLQAYAGPHSYNPHFATHLRLDSLFFGVLLAYFHHFAPARLNFVARSRTKLLCLGAVLLGAYPAFVASLSGGARRPVVGSVGFVMLYVAYGCLLLVVVHTPVDAGWLGRRLGGFSARLVAFIGYYSYPIYLWHLDANRPISKGLGCIAPESLPPELRWVLAFGIYVLAAVAAGVVFGLLLEKPTLALRDRLFPGRTRALPDPNPSDNHHPREVAAAPRTEPS